jgi:hypothetical protein
MNVKKPPPSLNPDGTYAVIQYFEMKATFNSEAPGSCRCCQYRQYIKGYVKVKAPGGKWQKIPLQLAYDKQLEEGIFQEDGDADGNAYGHRAFPCLTDNYYGRDGKVDRPEGCIYAGWDSPGLLRIPSGWSYDIHLDFKGVIIDLCNRDREVAKKTWPVRLKDRVP